MPRTRTDLIVEVLDLLGVTETGQDPSAEDATLVDGKINTVLARLAARGVVYIPPSLGQFDDAYFDPLAVIVANNVGPKFGQSFDASVDEAQEALIRDMQATRRASSVLRTCYF